MDIRNAIIIMCACGTTYAVNNHFIKIEGKEKNEFADIDQLLFNRNIH